MIFELYIQELLVNGQNISVEDVERDEWKAIIKNKAEIHSEFGFKGGAVIISHSFAQATTSQPAISPAKGKLSKYIESRTQAVGILFGHALLVTSSSWINYNQYQC
jgi:hypothetical protein